MPYIACVRRSLQPPQGTSARRRFATFCYREFRHHGDHWPEAHGGPAFKAETPRLSGLALWSIAHIYFLIGFRNRLLVAMNWGWNYVTFQRGTRLITGASGSRAEEVIRPQSHLDAHQSAA